MNDVTFFTISLNVWQGTIQTCSGVQVFPLLYTDTLWILENKRKKEKKKVTRLGPNSKL